MLECRPVLQVKEAGVMGWMLMSERTMSEPAVTYEVHPTMTINGRRRFRRGRPVFLSVVVRLRPPPRLPRKQSVICMPILGSSSQVRDQTPGSRDIAESKPPGRECPAWENYATVAMQKVRRFRFTHASCGTDRFREMHSAQAFVQQNPA